MSHTVLGTVGITSIKTMPLISRNIYRLSSRYKEANGYIVKRIKRKATKTST